MSGTTSASMPPPGTTTSSSRAPLARPSPERARVRRGPGRFGAQTTCAASRRSRSALPSTSRSASA
eukprot:11828079-Alexandrium_andersonii.AAC.1